MWSRRWDTAKMCDIRIWRVGIARNAMFSIVLWLRWLGKSIPKNGRAQRIGWRCGKICTTPARERPLKNERFGALLEAKADKICTTPARENDLEVKIVKSWGCGSTMQVEIAKICTTPARDNDLEVKIVKNWEPRTIFGSWSRQDLHHACARERFESQNR